MWPQKPSPVRAFCPPSSLSCAPAKNPREASAKSVPSIICITLDGLILLGTFLSTRPSPRTGRDLCRIYLPLRASAWAGEITDLSTTPQVPRACFRCGDRLLSRAVGLDGREKNPLLTAFSSRWKVSYRYWSHLLNYNAAFVPCLAHRHRLTADEPRAWGLQYSRVMGGGTRRGGSGVRRVRKGQSTINSQWTYEHGPTLGCRPGPTKVMLSASDGDWDP